MGTLARSSRTISWRNTSTRPVLRGSIGALTGRPAAGIPASWSSTTAKRRVFLSRRTNKTGRAVIQPAGERIGTAELYVALEEALSRRSGTQRRVTGLERRPSLYSTSYAIDELDARLDDGTSLRVLYKDLSRHALLEAARQAKPIFL